jgi:hypothetical protein
LLAAQAALQLLGVERAVGILLEPDNDGTLDAKEMKSPAGKTLARLIK